MNTNDKKIKNLSTKELKKQKRQILDSLPPMDDIIRGSLITRRIKCGKPNCHCATGEGHKSFYLSSYYHGRTYMDYVPRSWKDWMSRSIESYYLIQNLLTQLTEINLELFRRREHRDNF